jgi:hypothetical protein
MARLHHVHVHVGRASDSGIDIIDLEPEKDTVAIWSGLRITNPPVVVLDVPPVQLEDQCTVGNEPLVFAAAVVAPAAQEALVPSAARLDIAHADQRLGTHANLRTFTA